jgi:IS4 transposase
LVVSRICDAHGQVLAQWLLLTNVPDEVDARTIARWYYYRWQIESMFKLLKSAGQQVERGGPVRLDRISGLISDELRW